jgi:sulfane dehydrogenase subunit SoxC
LLPPATKDKWVYVEGADASSNGRSIPMEKALDDCARRLQGQWRGAAHGARLPGSPRRSRLGRQYVGQVAAPHRGGDDAPSKAARKPRNTPTRLADGTSRKWTWVMDAKSVITSPSPQSPITHGQGPLVITGLAWSGRGTITGVDVTLDGGKNWQEARLAAPGLDKALTRFYLDINWDGSEMFLQSRAMDDTGYVQPTKASCARCVATTRSITTTASRPGGCARRGGGKC